MRTEELDRSRTRERIFRGGSWHTGPITQCEHFVQWESDGRIFGVEYNGAKYYATYQFDHEGIPMPIIKEVLQQLCREDPWGIAAWFYFPNSWISVNDAPVSPRDALSMHDDVRLAAMRSAGTYVS